MKQTSGPGRRPAETVIKDIRRVTSRQFSPEKTRTELATNIRVRENRETGGGLPLG